METAEWLERRVCRVYLRRRGSRSGNWVVLLHGAGADGAMFDAGHIANLDNPALVNGRLIRFTYW